MATKTVKVNEWQLEKAGPLGKPYTRFDASRKEMIESKIPAFNKYYRRYFHSMRTPVPQEEIKTEQEYKAEWISDCITILQGRNYDNDSLEEIASSAESFYRSYGSQGKSAQATVDSVDGTAEENWKKDLKKKLDDRKNTQEYQEIDSYFGKEESPDYVQMMYDKYYPEMRPGETLPEFFAMATALKNSKISKGVYLNLVLPDAIVSVLKATSIEVVGSDSVSYRGSKKGTFSIPYVDEDKSIFNALDKWLQISSNNNLPQAVYAATGSIVGINNVTQLEDIKYLKAIYPVGVTTKKVDFYYEEKTN